ncbi:hypothetical protein YSY43_20900 [Paenibacillus sp. YSY-4.3]
MYPKNFELRDQFYNTIKNFPLAKNVVFRLLEEGNLLLFGGAIRSYYENQFSTMPRDFDIVVCTRNDELDQYFFNVPYTRNRYGGYKINIYPVGFDIWSINSTWAFKNGVIENPNVENLTKTVFLNYDSVVYDLTTGEVYDEDYQKAKENKKLDIILEQNPFPELNILRSLVFKTRYNMDLSEALYDYMKSWRKMFSNNEEINVLSEVQIKHYGFEYMTKKQLFNELQLIR